MNKNISWGRSQKSIFTHFLSKPTKFSKKSFILVTFFFIYIPYFSTFFSQGEKSQWSAAQRVNLIYSQYVELWKILFTFFSYLEDFYSDYLALNHSFGKIWTIFKHKE